MLADDPLLTCRMEGGKNPLRVICDTRLRAPLDQPDRSNGRAVPTILATACGDAARRAPYEAAGCRSGSSPARTAMWTWTS